MIQLTEEQIKELQAKAKSYDELEEKISQCYDEELMPDADLLTIGEITAVHFGFL